MRQSPSWRETTKRFAAIALAFIGQIPGNKRRFPARVQGCDMNATQISNPTELYLQGSCWASHINCGAHLHGARQIWSSERAEPASKMPVRSQKDCRGAGKRIL